MTDQREKPSVAMVGKYFPPVRGGLEEYVHGLAEAVADSCNLTVIVHATDRQTTTVETGTVATGCYRVTRCATWFTAASQPFSPALFKHLRARRWDIVHLHVPNVLGILAVMTCAPGARLIVTHHADMVGFGMAGRIAIWCYRRLLRRASAITVLSLKNRDLARDVGPTTVPFYALPVGLDPARFEATPAAKAAANALRATCPEGDLVLAFVGRLVPYKGQDVLIDAIAQVPGVSCLIAGDGRERSALAARAQANGVADRIHFMGDISEDERLAVLHAADVFVLPSITSAEAFGIVQVEAQLCGLPVITTDLPTGVTDVTRHGETGLVVPPGDARALAAAITRLRDDRALATALGAAGLARANAEYTRDALRDRSAALYHRVMAEPRPSV